MHLETDGPKPTVVVVLPFVRFESAVVSRIPINLCLDHLIVSFIKLNRISRWNVILAIFDNMPDVCLPGCEWRCDAHLWQGNPFFKNYMVWEWFDL